MKHCNTEIEIKSGNSNGKKMFYAECPVCHIKHKSEKKEDVEKYFQNAVLRMPSDNISANNIPVISAISIIPKSKTDLESWYKNNFLAMKNNTLQIQSKPATERMIAKNYTYLMRIIDDKKFKKITDTEIGMQSITDAYGDALSMAATLGEMGDIVPFGAVAEFVPNIECYKFALETGNNAPFKDIAIDLVYENDQTDNGQKDGNFYFDFIKRGIPRGEVIAVVVSGIRTDVNKRIGEIYDVDRIIDKAERHSPAYRNYLIEKAEFKKLQVEGKLKSDSQGLHYEKDIPKGDGGTWKKKVYENDITNPYDGPDRPEMLRKAAGKSFFRPYMKTRNASAMAEEWQNEDPENREQAADFVLNRASEQFGNSEQFKETSKIKDAEIVVEKNDKSDKSDKTDKGLFNEETEL